MTRLFAIVAALMVCVTLVAVATAQLATPGPRSGQAEDRGRRSGLADAEAEVKLPLPPEAQVYPQDPSAMRGRVVHVYIDPKGRRLAAWQFELSGGKTGAEVVGVEGGEGVFTGQAERSDRPYYDPAALRASGYGRIIVGDFTTADAQVLPTGEVRVASIHYRLKGEAGERGEGAEAKFEATLAAAADAEGKAIDGAGIRIEITGDDDVKTDVQ